MMKDILKKIFFLFMMLPFGFCAVLLLKRTDKINVYIISEGIVKGYDIVDSKKNQKTILELYSREIAEGIFTITMSVGSPARYSYYIDTKDFKISTTYFNPKLFGDKYVAYMEDGELILTDLFQEGILNKRIIRDFTKTADPISAITKIEMIDDGHIVLEYYKGDYIEESEVILIDEDIGGLQQ